MLAASESAPNPRMSEAPVGIRPPRPEGWAGVAESLRQAEALMGRGDFLRAEDILLGVLDFAPLEGRAWHMLGRCRQAQQRHAAALESFARAGECYRRHARAGTQAKPPASARLAELLWRQGEKAEAEAMLDELLRAAPADEALQRLHRQFQQAAFSDEGESGGATMEAEP